MWSLNSNSILTSYCKQSDCKQRAARTEGSWKRKFTSSNESPRIMGFAPRGCIAVCRKSDGECSWWVPGSGSEWPRNQLYVSEHCGCAGTSVTESSERRGRLLNGSCVILLDFSFKLFSTYHNSLADWMLAWLIWNENCWAFLIWLLFQSSLPELSTKNVCHWHEKERDLMVLCEI